MPDIQVPDDFDDLIKLAATAPRQASDLFTNTQRFRLFYTEYEILRFYRTHSGLTLMPVAATSGQARLVRLHAPYTKAMVVWRAQRYGDNPVLPDADSGNPNEVFADSLLAVQHPALQPGGKGYMFTVQGVFWYWLLTPMAKNDPPQIPASPLFQTTVDEFNARGFTFSKDILKSQPPAAFTSPSTSNLNVQVVT